MQPALVVVVMARSKRAQANLLDGNLATATTLINRPHRRMVEGETPTTLDVPPDHVGQRLASAYPSLVGSHGLKPTIHLILYIK
jgi:hypothetical protein